MKRAKPINPKVAVNAEFKHPGVKGVTLQCPKCRSEYHNCHPTADCFCGFCSKPLARVRLCSRGAIEAVEIMVLRWFMASGKQIDLFPPNAIAPFSEAHG